MRDAFLERCLLLDLETRGDEDVLKVGAVARARQVCFQGTFRREDAFAALDTLADGADFVLGHNLLGHDLPILRRLAPHLRLLHLPVVDTLYLSPLAFPENPYHHLVKDYKLLRHSVNDPVADARLAARVFKDQWESFGKTAQGEPELIRFYAFALAGVTGDEGLPEVLRTIAGGTAAMDAESALDYLERSFDAQICGGVLRRLAAEEFFAPEKRAPWAYATAWLRVAGGNSVLPPWVRHRYPRVVDILRALRDVPCGVASCAWCRTAHDPVAQLRRFFGFENFRPQPEAEDGTSLQESIVRAGQAQRPHLAILATGAGKSICYQLPALIRYFRRGQLTIVVSPLQALMKDQVDNLNAATGNDSSAALYGMLTPPERGAVLERLRLGELALLYVSPEQLRNMSFRRAVEQREVGAWVFDEAHCLSKWGHDFRPDYLYAARYVRELAKKQGVPPPPVAGFTATAKLDVREEVRSHFKDELGQDLEVFAGTLDRAELHFRIEPAKSKEKNERVFELVTGALEKSAGGSAVVYYATRRGAEQGAEFLRLKDVRAEAFHAGLPVTTKRDVLDAFVAGRVPVVCATNAFGMGIDKEDVRLVVHADIPGSLESYLQEAGRAGRDRRPSDCVLLYDEDDVERQFALSAMSKISLRDVRELLRGLRRQRDRQGEMVTVTTGELLADQGIETDFAPSDFQADTKVKTAVAWLERAGFVDRNENQTNVFQGRPRFENLGDAKLRLEQLDLSRQQVGRCLNILDVLAKAEPDDLLTADRLAEKARVGSSWDPTRDEKSPARQVVELLHDLEQARLVTSGPRLTAFVYRGGQHSSSRVLEKTCALENALLDLLAESAPDAAEDGWQRLGLRAVNQRLVDEGQLSNPELLRRLLSSLAADGKRQAGRHGTVELRYHSKDSLSLRVLRDWPELRKTAVRRQASAKAVLDRLVGLVPEGTTGKVLVEFGTSDLTDAIGRNLVLRAEIQNRLVTAERALLFLHEQKAIQLQRGLAVFRQAMTIRIRPEAKGRRYNPGDYAPLEQHYAERNFQVHVMGRYARLGLEKVRNALRLVRDYFELNRQRFADAYFAQEKDVLERATGRESFAKIVDALKNPNQIRLVAAPEDENLLILAGPGSGKTRVVVHRTAYLLRVLRVPARSILVVCFNRHAAFEVRRRLTDLVGGDARGVTVRTYHALAMRLTGRSLSGLAATSADALGQVIPEAVRLLTEEGALPGFDGDELRERLLAGYSHILIDEYQDINEDQYALISAIAGRAASDSERRLTILAVGDDDQAIYGFTGADVLFIRRFRKDYEADVHYLVQNYRSTGAIIACANQVIGTQKGRLKSEHPIRLDDERRKRARQEEPVVLRSVADLTTQATAVAERFRQLHEAGADWDSCAVLARQHAVLGPIRAALEAAGVPVCWTPGRDAMPPLFRIREVNAFLAALKERRGGLVRASALNVPRKDGNPWYALLAEIAGQLLDETADAEMPMAEAVEFFYEALAEKRREPSFGQGVRLMTVHGAKGLEFDHVVLADGGWQCRRQELDEQRRLYYVGMTRARQTLCLLETRSERHPFLGDLPDDGVERSRDGVPAVDGSVDVVYEVLTPGDLFLDYAGQRTGAVHRHLAGLEPGDALTLVEDGSVFLADGGGFRVARLSKSAAQRWRPLLAAVTAVKVLALFERRAEDSGEDYRERLRVDRWEVPIVEIVRHGPGAKRW